MKKLAVSVLVLAVVVLLWLQVRSSARIQMSFLHGETVRLHRDDLTIPIEASGTIEPSDRIEIKSEAAGTVRRTPFEVGELVKSGDVLVELDPENEQRLVDKAEKAVLQAKINLRRAEWTLEQRKQEIPSMEARIANNQADVEYWTWKHERWQEIESGTHQDEVRLISSNKAKALALAAQLKAQLEQARHAVELAALELGRAELTLQQAQTDLADARERLQETTIMAPQDGMLVRLQVKKGSVIASGSMSLTGGTPLAYLADVTQLYVRALVDEADIGRVYEIAPDQARPGREPAAQRAPDAPERELPLTLGTPVEITVEAFPEETFTGYIDLIEPEPSQSVGDVVVNYVVWIRLDSPEASKLQLGMQANVRFVSESVEDAVLLPNEAVRIVGGQRGVYVPVESETNPGSRVPKFKTIRAGLDDGMHTQILDGLAEGDEVYVKLPRNARGEQITGDE